LSTSGDQGGRDGMPPEDVRALENWPKNLADSDDATLMRQTARVLEAQMVALLSVQSSEENRRFLRETCEPLARELGRRADEKDHVSPEPRGNA